MDKKELKQYLPVFREGALALKEFYKLSYTDKLKYIQVLENLAPDILGETDKHILHFYSTKKEQKHFITIKDEFTL